MSENTVAELAVVVSEDYSYSIDSLMDDYVLWNHDRELWEEQEPRWLEVAKMAGENWGRVNLLLVWWMLAKMSQAGYFNE